MGAGLMNPVQSVSSVLRNLLNFEGRASRSEFWWFFPIVFLVAIALPGLVPGFGVWSLSGFFIGAFGLIQLFFTFAFLLPVIYLVLMPAVTVRRLHDTGRSARWLLFCFGILLGWGIIAGLTTLVGYTGDEWAALGLGLISGGIWTLVGMIGIVVMTYFLTLPGTTGPNYYGPDPVRPDLGDARPPRPAGVYATPPQDDARTGADLAEAPAHRFCTQCGMQMQPEARFCTVCGTAA